MATTKKKKSKSVLKRQRQTGKRTARNKSVKSEIRTWMRRVNDDLKAGNLEAAKKSMQSLSSRLDKAVKKGVIHANNAANKKSSAMSRLRALAAKPQ